MGLDLFRKKSKLIVGLSFLFCVMILVQMAYNSSKGPQVVLHIGRGALPINSINGVFQGVLLFLCVVMVCSEEVFGAYFSYLVMLCSMITGIVSTVFFGNLTSLPGCINSFVGLFTLHVISYQYGKSKKDSITDFVTGLGNRRGFTKTLKQKLYEHKSGAVVYIQLKDFRSINDNLGHEYGDKLLQKVAGILKEEVGSTGGIFKIDGAEYALILSKDVDADALSRRILSKINERMVIEKDGAELNYYLSAYVGIAMFPEHATQIDLLMKYTDIAMFSAISEGDNQVRVFDGDMEKNMTRQAEVERLVKESLDKDYFFLVYQPQYVIEDKKLRGFETLIRMKLPDGSMVSPGEFIPVAEKSDLILKIDEYVLNSSMRIFSPIIKGAHYPFVISINVSAKSMALPGFVDMIESLLKKNDFPAEYLEIEITEYSFVDSMARTIDNICQLRSLGVQIALDDFGTGFTSLSQLLNLPVNLLKIDKSLIDGIEENEKNRDFVDAVIYMGHLMGCEVISEGVENVGQLELLKAHECDFVQGYVWGRPLPFTEALEIVNG